MYTIWMDVDWKKAMGGLVGFLAFLALLIHFILLSSNRYSWIENGTLSASEAPVGVSSPAAAGEMAPLPPGR